MACQYASHALAIAGNWAAARAEWDGSGVVEVYGAYGNYYELEVD